MTPKLGSPYFRNGDIHGRRAWACLLNCLCHLAQVDLRHSVVMVDVAETERTAILAGEEHLVRLRVPNRCLVREREPRVSRDGADRGVRPEDLEEPGVEDLKERWGRVGGVEELSDGRFAEGPVNAEHVKREGIDELRVIDADGARRRRAQGDSGAAPAVGKP